MCARWGGRLRTPPHPVSGQDHVDDVSETEGLLGSRLHRLIGVHVDEDVPRHLPARGVILCALQGEDVLEVARVEDEGDDDQVVADILGVVGSDRCALKLHDD